MLDIINCECHIKPVRKHKLRMIIIGLSLALLLNNSINSQAETAYPTNLELQIHELINQERSRVVPNHPQLKFHSVLIEIARDYSKYMYDEDHFAHEDKNGNGPDHRVENKGVRYTLVAENLYWALNILEKNIANSAVDGWIESPGHYENIKSSTSFTGIGIYSQNGEYYITQLFIEASETHMRSIGVVYSNDNLEPSKEPSIIEKYQQEIFVFGLILFVVLLGKKAESLNRRGYRR